jgi:hypothetical protein
VADEDDRHATGHHLLQGGEQRRRLCGVSTAVGSSRINARAPRINAFRFNRWRSPTESSPTRVGLDSEAEALRDRSSCARFSARLVQSPQRLGAEHHVVERAQLSASVKC